MNQCFSTNIKTNSELKTYVSCKLTILIMGKLLAFETKACIPAQTTIVYVGMHFLSKAPSHNNS